MGTIIREFKIPTTEYDYGWINYNATFVKLAEVL